MIVVDNVGYWLTNTICKYCGSDEVVTYKTGNSRCAEETCTEKDNVVKTLDNYVYANGRNIVKGK
tara:strand:+ start:715 stop:909 length:195 start_codon:yes stop_codon:yes gene_type:complete